MNVNYGGCVVGSTVDFPGRMATVIFLRGCSHKCPWCHNPRLQTGENFVPIEQLYDLMEGHRKFISAIVISGGEPLEQPEATIALVKHAHGIGLKAGVQTAGLPVEILAELMDKAGPDFILIGGPKYDPRGNHG